MHTITISVEQAVIFERLLMENRESAKLQKESECSYLESINILNELREKLGRQKDRQRQVEIMTSGITT